ncbi:MAG: SIS domain-containing protein [Anaerolineae bacterium]|nr:SIS domain-containing protein [Anaerolineae bacterium]
MAAIKPEVIIRQVEDLPQLTRTHVEPFAAATRAVLSALPAASVQRVVTAGNGDSYHAARACELAFTSMAGIANEPFSAQRFLDYGVDVLPVAAPDRVLVAGISASGGTADVVQLLEKARVRGMKTVAITGASESAVAQAAEHVLAVPIPDFGRSPGIRTYQASLMGLLLLAIGIGEHQGRYSAEGAGRLRQELVALGGVIQATYEACQEPARAAAQAFRDEPALLFLGSGPSYGTALFSAAKVVEAAGLFAVGQELEEWWHVERFAYPAEMVTFVIAPPGRSHGRAVELAAEAQRLGRRVVAVVQEGDEEIGRHAAIVFPVMGAVREAFSPLVYHLCASVFASYVAETLGRAPFQSDKPLFQAAVDNYYAGRGSR